ncbi:unnamed protein product, partial [Thelazia callipaeda]|uniref:PKD_channel domain-containing protein n=1 Tax=Thelazia callipaeda TaxID=103827 RepID=A0A0N5CTN7_THECL
AGDIVLVENVEFLTRNYVLSQNGNVPNTTVQETGEYSSVTENTVVKPELSAFEADGSDLNELKLVKEWTESVKKSDRQRMDDIHYFSTFLAFCTIFVELYSMHSVSRL